MGDRGRVTRTRPYGKIPQHLFFDFWHVSGREQVARWGWRMEGEGHQPNECLPGTGVSSPGPGWPLGVHLCLKQCISVDEGCNL